MQYARLLATIVRKEGLRPFVKPAICRVIEHAARLVEDSQRVTARMQTIVDLLEEADYFAGAAGADRVDAKHVQEAIDSQVYRSDRIRQRMQDQVLRETIFIDTDGERIGQINALSVIQLGQLAFGRPSRITASVRMGKGELVDIEREVELSGPLHSKGVLILSSFLRARYAAERPLSLGASLVFEQSYGGVDGDSASSTELYVLLSAIAQVPIKQSLAVTGSVNQYGHVQAIGGVNEKIEGFFDLCHARGLTGHQGVLIPASNVKHLMLRRDVVEAVADGKFSVHAIETIDQGIEILTGIPAGERDEEGIYLEGTINRMVEDRLASLAEKRKEFDSSQGEDGKSGLLEQENQDVAGSGGE
jgi:predicted ATP-dependent protease